MKRFALSLGGLAALIALAIAPAASAKTVWLCAPGGRSAVSPDPCLPGLSTTVYSPTLKPVAVIRPRAVKPPPIDCFYVYPTVSGQPTGNANLNVDPVERSIALYQAARYSQYCRMFAPMYRQLTLAGIGQGMPTTPPDPALGLADVREAFRDYLLHYNHGRGFVLIGHSQGSFVLRSLIARDIDPKPAVRRRMISAILMGGNVLVKSGRGIGGDFKHIPACRSAIQLGCVIAFSTFDTPVLSNSKFGISMVSGDSVLCTNPAALGGGSGLLTPINPSEPFYQGSILAAGIKLLGITQPMPPTVWSTEPGSYSARCSSANNANVLQISARGGAQTPNPSPDGTWGLHLLDANIALGNLVSIVKAEAATFVRSGR
jgi:hypothetical protein